MNKTGTLAPKTSVQKITAKLGLNDNEFKKTLNIIDHWLKIPSPNKIIETNIICNQLQNQRGIEWLKLDIERHSALPSMYVITSLLEGTSSPEMQLHSDPKSKWHQASQIKLHQLFQDIMVLYLFIKDSMLDNR